MNLFELLKGFFEKKPETVIERATGSIINTPDTRDIYVDEAVAPIPVPGSFETDISKIPVEDQKWLGICVSEAMMLGKSIQELKETGNVITFSKRIFYTLARQLAGYKPNDSQQGLPPRVSAKILLRVGAVPQQKFSVDNVELTHEEYTSLVVTDDMKKAGEPYKVKGYAFIKPDDLHMMKQMIVQQGYITATLPYQPESWFQAMLKKVFKIFSYHYILIYGYSTENGDTLFKFRNSWSILWGNSGNGVFKWSEYSGQVIDAIAFLDLPNDVIERAKASRYVFVRSLGLGARGEDVRKLQERLKEMGLLQDNEPTGYFGLNTKVAVIEWQDRVGLPSTGYFGEMSRAKMNESATSKAISKIDEWCRAIEIMEGAKKSLNNPGNIRYIGQKTAIGKDSRGFCIFPDYATGYLALRNLLVNACTGKSKVYYPEMTLRQFYDVYAPAEDQNNPSTYAKFVAGRIGVTVDTPIKELL